MFCNFDNSSKGSIRRTGNSPRAMSQFKLNVMHLFNQTHKNNMSITAIDKGRHFGSNVK